MPSLGSRQCSTANKQPKPRTLSLSWARQPPPPTPAGTHLVQCSQAIFIGQVGANPTGKELADCKKKAGRVLKRYQVPLPSGPRSYKHGAQGRKESPLRLDLSLY